MVKLVTARCQGSVAGKQTEFITKHDTVHYVHSGFVCPKDIVLWFIQM